MVIAIAAALAFQGSMPNQPQAVMSVYRNRMVSVNMMDAENNQAGNVSLSPNTLVTEHLGSLSWSVSDGLHEGRACKLFKAESTWRFFIRRRDNQKVWFAPKLYVYAWLDPEAGKLLRTQTLYTGMGIPKQVDAIFRKDDIEMVVTEGSKVRRATLYPIVPIEQFHELFKPFIQDGLVVDKSERTVAYIHPLTGAPTTMTVKVDGRFDGKMLFLPRNGYRLKITSEGNTLSTMVSREGQALTIDMSDEFQAVAQESIPKDVNDNWGQFKAEHWSQPASASHPQRPKHVTIMAPVMLKDPQLLFPYPLVVAL